MLDIRKNAIIIISECVFTVVLAICAFMGISDNSFKLEARALQVATDVLQAAGGHAQSAMAVTPAEKHTRTKKGKKHTGKAETDLKDGVYYGTGRGYGGNIKIKLTVENGKIKALDIVDASSETPSFFSRAMSVASAIVSAGTADVDGVSGATLSSNGIKAAAADAIKQAGGKGNTSIKAAEKTKASPKTGKTKKKKYSKPESGWKDGTYTGSANGFGGNVSVTVTIRNGKIKSISTSGPKETASYWNKAQAVKGKIIKSQNPKVDAVSGATYSSNGIINAVIAALSKAEKTSGPKTQTITTSKEEYEIVAGKTANIRAKAKTKLTYRSADNSIASVNRKGKVTAKAAGTVVITISAAKTSKYKKTSKKVKVIVSRREQTITIPGMAAGSAIVFSENDKGTELPLNAYSDSGKALIYSSDNDSVAMVSDQGVILVNGKGTARITIKAPQTKVYESAVAVLIVKVKAAPPEDPDKPVDPDDPENPEDPDKPVDPDDPEDPEDPDKPVDPDDPITPDEPDEINGTFTGSARGYGGDVTCQVVISDSIIKEITVDGPGETSKYWFKAKKIVPKMVSQQTWDVDAASGATISSNGIRNAVRQALESAGLI